LFKNKNMIANKYNQTVVGYRPKNCGNKELLNARLF